MADYLLVRDSDNFIVGYSSTVSSESGCRLVDINAQAITGHTVPSDLWDMTSGTLTTGFVYTKANIPNYAARDYAWDEATSDWVTNGTMTDDLKWKRCVKSGAKNSMDTADWDAIVLVYPQP